MQGRSRIQRNVTVRGGVVVVAALLGGGALVAACGSGSSTTSASTTSPSTAKGSGGSSGLESLVNRVSKTTDATFSATYETVDSTGKSETMTFAQSPPKSAIVTSSGSFLNDGSSVIACEGSGSSATCTSLPSSLKGEMSGLTNLFSPSVILNSLKGVSTQAAANAAGFDISTSSATYGGLASSCVTIKGSSEPKPVTYCAANSSGVLTYMNAGGSTVTLKSFTSNPPASTFSPPAGATVQTLPSGV